MAVAGLLGRILMAFMLTSSPSMVVTSTRQAAAVGGTAFLSAAWLIRVYVAKKSKDQILMIKLCAQR